MNVFNSSISVCGFCKRSPRKRRNDARLRCGAVPSLRYRQRVFLLSPARSRSKPNGMKATGITEGIVKQRRTTNGWRFVIMAMMTLVVAFSFAVTWSLASRALSSQGPLALEITVGTDHQLPTDCPDYGLVEHGIHCLGHAMVRDVAPIAEPSRIPSAARRFAEWTLPRSTGSAPPEKPPRL
jgi:hypothetical protein